MLQFEGGLPAVVSKGNSFTGNGDVSVAADPARDAFFVADLRSSLSASLSAIGLFRASSATLLNPSLCPDGTHTTVQAQACWTTTAPAIIDQVPSGGINNALDIPSVAVDERPANSGTGDSNVYIAVGVFSVKACGISLVSCTNSTLSCSTPIIISEDLRSRRRHCGCVRPSAARREHHGYLPGHEYPADGHN